MGLVSSHELGRDLAQPIFVNTSRTGDVAEAKVKREDKAAVAKTAREKKAAPAKPKKAE